MGVFDKPRSRVEGILMDIRDATSLSVGWAPKSRIEAILMQIRDGGGGGGDVPIATVDTVGTVKPDGVTLTIDTNGTLSLALANGDTVSY